MGRGPKSGTESETREHRFISFREKVDSIKIDPVRRTRKKVTDDSEQTSYFITAFNNWAELNISAKFSDFVDECAPYCQSFPQVLYHKDQIMELLKKYITLEDEHSLESLLDLLTHFAHDLGPDFEPYFHGSLTILVKLSSNDNISIVQWTFNCFAYLFKYLSRLLTADLKPTYNVLSTVLGKTQQKKHVTRFAAESLSFLVRKCTGESLTDIVNHIVLDVMTTHKEQFFRACIDLFTNSMTSSGNNLHSRTPSIIKTLLRSCCAQEDHVYSAEFISGVVASLLHHTRSESSATLYEPTLEFIDENYNENAYICTSVMYILAGLRQGSRVNDWNAIYTRGVKILEFLKSENPEENLIKVSMNMSISILQNADFKSSSMQHRKLLDQAFDLYGSSYFLPFCDSLLQQCQKAFKEFMRSYLDKYLKLYWENNEYAIALFLSHASKNGLITDGSIAFSAPLNIELSSPFAKSIQSSTLQVSKGKNITLSTLQSLWSNLGLYMTVLSPKLIKENLPQLIKQLRHNTNLGNENFEQLRSATLGRVLSLSSKCREADELNKLVCGFSEDVTSNSKSNVFLQGFLDILNELKKNKQSIPTSVMECFIDNLKDGVRSPSGDTRSLTLRVSCVLYELCGFEIPRVISTCELIGQIPLDVSNSRNLALHIRNVGIQYNASGTEFISDKLVTGYLFGLLTVRFKPIWDAVFESVEKISSKAADGIWELSWKWLAYSTEPAEFGIFSEIEEFPHVTKEFEATTTVNCANLNHVSDATSNTIPQYSRSHDRLSVETAEHLEPADLPPYVRTKTLELLLKVPRIAEQHAKSLVPYLLRDDDDEEEDDKAVLSSTWTQNDRIALLDIFSHFTNAKSLYRAEDVYNRYLYLLGSRVTKIQQKALSCIFTFKDPQVRKYRDNLTNLLDDTQFKDELTNFVRRSGEEEGTIHEEDRGAILPLVMRILFGRAQVAKTGGVKQGRRFAVINSLNNVEPEFVKLFVKLTSETLECNNLLVRDGDHFTLDTSHECLKKGDKFVRREHGFVTMLEDLLKQLRGKIQVAYDVIMEPLIFSLYHSQSFDISQMEESNITSRNVKGVRNIGLKCLDMLFQYFNNVEWKSYFGVIYDNFIFKKLKNFGPDNLGQTSGLMKLMSTLSTSASLIDLFAWDNFSIPKALFDCVNYDGVKDSVVELVINTMDNITEIESAVQVRSELVQVCAPILLGRLAFLFDRDSDNKLMEMESSILVKLLPESEVDEEVREQLVSVSMKALDKSSNQIRIPVKATILQALTGLLDERSTETEIITIYTSLSKLFKQFSDRAVRSNLAALYDSFGERTDKLARVGKLLVELNSYSKRRLELPDFERRLAAFSEINENIYSSFSPLEWRALLYNMLFFIKDPEELALRTGATYSLKRFIDCISVQPNQEAADPYVELLEEVLLPALKIGLRDSTELFRFDFIEILGHLIKTCQWYHGLDDMKCLLFDGDEEANFFNNIGHIQLHRRQRTVRRIGGFAIELKLKDSSIAHYLLPIIEHYVADTSGEAHNLATESIKVIGILARHLSWNQYRAITKRYVSYVNSRKETMKTNIKLIDTVSDALSEPVVEGEGNEDVEMKSEISSAGMKLAENLPSAEKLSNFITDDIVPTMQGVLSSRKGEAEETLTERIPLAIPIVKFIKCLPEELIGLRLPGVLTGFCQILRAKSQELRDMIRKSLGTIARILGAKYFVFIVKELKGALRRGTQLHVLGYTVHSLLTDMKDILKHGDLDDSVSMISEIMMEDIFGVTGTEKEEEDYKTQMKEVKHGKSFDNGNLLASNVSLEKFGSIIEPIKAILLYEKLTARIESKIEELLSRIAEGLYHNEDVLDQRVLKMCHELFRMIETVVSREEEKRKMREQVNFKDEHKKEIEHQYTVTLDSRHWDEKQTDLYIQNLHILKRFVIDALRRVFGRNENLLTVENVMGFIPIVETGLTDKYEDVQIASLRLLTLVFKLKLPNMDEKYKMYGRQTLNLIKGCSETNTELCQASLRMLATLIRQKEGFSMKDSALAYILQRIKPDLEEPNKQGITFTFIKSVLSRKIVMSEVYDVMDRIAQVMVTSQSGVIRDACRSAYFQFITEYPQGQGRLNKQLQFLVSNLNYSATSGRLSVMEMIHIFVTKVNSAQIEEFNSMFFAALVLVIVKDADTECRKTAALIIGEIIRQTGDTQKKKIEGYLIKWLSDDEKVSLVRGGMQAAGIYFTEVKNNHDIALLKLCEEKIVDAMYKGKSDTEGTVDWQLLYSSLQLLSKIVDVNPGNKVYSADYKDVWSLVEATLLYPQSWVRAVASRLMGKLYSKYDEGEVSDAITIVAPENLQTTAFKYIRQLGASGITTDDGVQIVKNLVFITRHWEQNGTLFEQPKTSPEVEDENNEEEGEEEEEEKPALDWLVAKVASVLRNEKRAEERAVSKRAAIQFLASVVQVVSKERLSSSPLSYDIVMAFYPISVSEEDRHAEFKDLCNEALKMVQDKLGTSEYLEVYSKVREAVQARRIQRKAKRSIQAVAAPELHAQKKLKKHKQQREKRKHQKDESGYYHGKKKKRQQ